MKAAIYCRVSTDEQKQGGTIESQIKELDMFATSRGDAVIEMDLPGTERRDAVHLEAEHLGEVLLGRERQAHAAREHFRRREAQAHG